jgi:head-tail adaptor
MNIKTLTLNLDVNTTKGGVKCSVLSAKSFTIAEYAIMKKSITIRFQSNLNHNIKFKGRRSKKYNVKIVAISRSQHNFVKIRIVR